MFPGGGRVFVVEIGENESASRDFDLSIGQAHRARIELVGESVRAYLDGIQIIEATNLPRPPGLFGLFAYREDIIPDEIRIGVIQTSAPPPAGAPPPGPPSGPPPPPSPPTQIDAGRPKASRGARRGSSRRSPGSSEPPRCWQP